MKKLILTTAFIQVALSIVAAGMLVMNTMVSGLVPVWMIWAVAVISTLGVFVIAATHFMIWFARGFVQRAKQQVA